MKYYCFDCDYETDDKSNWAKHKKSRKHVIKSNKNNDNLVESTTNLSKSTEKSNEMTKSTTTAPHDTPQHPTAPKNTKSNNIAENKDIKCTFCGVEFTRSSSLLRHYNVCKDKNINTHELVFKLETEKKMLELKLESCESKNKILKKENEYHKQLIISAGNMIQSSMSTLNHLILNYNNAPILEPLKDYSILEDENKFINNLTYYHNENKLEEYLGNLLVKQYKTVDPTKRSNWNSDTSRLTYINRELVNNKPNWVIDKKGIKMSNIIIKPFMDYIKKVAQNEIFNINKEIQDEDNENCRNYLIKKITTLSEIIININNNALSKNINRYLAPHFYFDKNNILVMR